MKKTLQITGILLMAVIAGNTALNAQRGMRNGSDTTRTNRPGRETGFRQSEAPGQKGDSLHMKRRPLEFARGPMGDEMRDRRGNDMRKPMRGDFRGPVRGDFRGQMPGNRFGMRDGMTPPPSDRMDYRNRRPGIMRPEAITNLTEKQKTDIAALRKTQQEEMKKLKDDMNVKMEAIREDHKKKLMGILSEEQKKQLESGSATTAPEAPKTPKAK
jgi:hypothetical protein